MLSFIEYYSMLLIVSTTLCFNLLTSSFINLSLIDQMQMKKEHTIKRLIYIHKWHADMLKTNIFNVCNPLVLHSQLRLSMIVVLNLGFLPLFSYKVKVGLYVQFATI